MFPTVGSSAGLDLAILGSAKRKEALLTWNMPEVCLCVVLSVSLYCVCSDPYPLSTVYVGNQSSRLLEGIGLCGGVCLKARSLIASLRIRYIDLADTQLLLFCLVQILSWRYFFRKCSLMVSL